MSAERKNSAFRKVKEEGAWSFEASSGPVSISGPSWTSMMTGVWCDVHNVTDNSFEYNTI